MLYKKIWDKILRPDEQVMYEFSISNIYRWLTLFIQIAILPILGVIAFIALEWLNISLSGAREQNLIDPVIFIVAILTAGCFILLGVLFYFLYYLKIANAYALTNRRIIIYTGWLSTNTVSVDFTNITDLQVTASLVERLFFGTGTLYINTAGTDSPEIILRHIANPHSLKNKLVEIQTKTGITKVPPAST